MPNRKSSRSYFEYPLTKTNKGKISEIIDDEFNRFLKHNMTSMDEATREKLRRMAVDQLSEYMSELSDEKTRWNLDGSVITVHVQTKLDNVAKADLERKKLDERDKYRFIQRSNKWELIYEDSKETGIPYSAFSKEVYRQMYEAAGTAAFYAIDSWFK